MSTPMLTSEGFVGQRMVINDYFRAGETLHAGDVVIARQRSASPYLTRVYQATGPHKQRVIGIVHTPAGKQVGDRVATTGATAAEDEFVPVVVQGIAQALSGEAIGVGDTVASTNGAMRGPARSSGAGTVAVVVRADAQDPNIVGKCLTSANSAQDVVDILVDLAGPIAAATSATPNRAPTARAGYNQAVNTGAAVTLDGSGSSDPDSGDTLSYAWTQVSGTRVTLSGSASSRASFTAPATAGSLAFRLTVTDSHAASDTDDVTITVQQANPPPPSTLATNSITSFTISSIINGGSWDGNRFEQGGADLNVSVRGSDDVTRSLAFAGHGVDFRFTRNGNTQSAAAASNPMWWLQWETTLNGPQGNLYSYIPNTRRPDLIELTVRNSSTNAVLNTYTFGASEVTAWNWDRDDDDDFRIMLQKTSSQYSTAAVQIYNYVAGALASSSVSYKFSLALTWTGEDE